MARKTTPTQVLFAMERVAGVDMQNFKYRMGTGRCLYDGEIMELMGCPGWTAYNSEMRAYADMLGSFIEVDTATLKEKKYITATAIQKAVKINDLYLRQEKSMGSPKPPAGSGLQLQSSFGGGGGQTHFAGSSPKKKGKTAAKKNPKKKGKKGSGSLAAFGVMPEGQSTLPVEGEPTVDAKKFREIVG